METLPRLLLLLFPVCYKISPRLVKLQLTVEQKKQKFRELSVEFIFGEIQNKTETSLTKSDV